MSLDKLTIKQLKDFIAEVKGPDAVPKGNAKKVFLEYIQNNIEKAHVDRIAAEMSQNKASSKKTASKKSTAAKKTTSEKKSSVKKPSVSFTITQEMYQDLLNRIKKLEDIIQTGAGNSQGGDGDRPVRNISLDEILSKIETIILKNPTQSRWIRIDWLYDDLKVYGTARNDLDEKIMSMYYNEKLDLSEGGESTYRIKIRGTEFGRIALRK